MCYYVPESKTVLLNLKKKNQYRQRFYIVNAYPIKTNFMINPTHYIMLPICCPQDFKFIKALWQSVEWTLFEPYVLCSIFPTTHQKTKPCGKKTLMTTQNFSFQQQLSHNMQKRKNISRTHLNVISLAFGFRQSSQQGTCFVKIFFF